MAEIDNCDGSNYLRRVCDGGGGGGGGGSAFNDTLSNGDGIANLSYDGSSPASVSVNSTVVRNTSNQTILGGLTANYLRSHGPITGQGLNISGVFVVEADGSVGGTSPSATQVIAWDGSQWAPADGGGGASVTATNIGPGSGIVSGVVSNDLKVKSLRAGSNITIDGDSNSLTISSSGSSDANISFSTDLASGASEYLITYPSSLDSAPQVSVTVENSGNGGIMPYAISGVTESNYTVIFSQLIPDDNYSIHTILGGGSNILSGRWSTGSSNSIYYDQGNVGIGTSDPTRPLQVDSTAGGVLLPRLTNAQESAATPSNGEIIYNTSTNKFRGYENGSWVDLV